MRCIDVIKVYVVSLDQLFGKVVHHFITGRDETSFMASEEAQSKS